MKNIEECGFTRINPEDAVNMDFNPFKKIGKEWMLVTAGDEQKWNTMTASWGFAGVMWGKKYDYDGDTSTEIHQRIH